MFFAACGSKALGTYQTCLFRSLQVDSEVSSLSERCPWPSQVFYVSHLTIATHLFELPHFPSPNFTDLFRSFFLQNTSTKDIFSNLGEVMSATGMPRNKPMHVKRLGRCSKAIVKAAMVVKDKIFIGISDLETSCPLIRI